MRVWTFVTNGGRPSPGRYSVPLTAEAGDRVMLWRSSRGGGVVAIGSITRVEAPPDPLAQVKLAHLPTGRGVAADRDPGYRVARVAYTGLFLSRPLSGHALRSLGLLDLARAGNAGRSGYHHTGCFAPLELDTDTWKTLTDALEGEHDGTSASAWPIEPGTVLRHDDVHDRYGGPRAAAECSSPHGVNDLLFVSYRPEDPELAWQWDGEVLVVAGQQEQAGIGAPGNASTVTDHLHRGRALRVFVTQGELCIYVGEFLVDQGKAIERWVDAGRQFIRSRNSIPLRMIGPSMPARSKREPVDCRIPLLRIRQLDGAEIFTPRQDDPFAGAHPARLVIAVRPRQFAIPGPADGPTATASAIRGLIEIIERDPGAAISTEDIDAVEALNALMQHRRRQADLDRLRAAVADPRTMEADLQKLLETMLWLFGGAFLPEAGRRRLTERDELDFALIRPDGSLHGIEIKRARIRRMLKRQRNHHILGRELYEARGQANNYLVHLDEQRPRILAEHRIDTRRATMTVIIGSAQHADPRYSPEQITETLRIENGSFPRVWIVTYDQFIEDAQQLLTRAE